LHWIRENLAIFSGDPSKVVIWRGGGSAGAASVGVQLAAYGGKEKGLFRAGICGSGGPINSKRYSNPTAWKPYYKNITDTANRTNSTDGLGCVLKVPVDVLSSVFNNSATASASFEAQIDGDFVHE
jgi:carboxylesterase type B